MLGFQNEMIYYPNITSGPFAQYMLGAYSAPLPIAYAWQAAAQATQPIPSYGVPASMGDPLDQAECWTARTIIQARDPSGRPSHRRS
jgi:hypothetical protein